MQWRNIFVTTLSVLVLGALAQDPFACVCSSATQPCKIGCCGKNNVCGLGPNYCAPENCQNSCDAKSDCDPGWGSQWSSREKCPLNVCCSKFGFCGTTSDFCGTATVKQPSCSGTSSNQRVVGYYEGWAQTRACNDMLPENIPFSAYTHLNFAFAFIDPNSYAVAPMSAGDVDLYTRFTGLKQANPGLQTWIAIGGWSMNDPDQPTHSTFSELAASSSAQAAFFKSLLTFMSTYGFDGIDIDWEYPGAPERSGNTADFANYVSFLKNLKNALGSSGHNYGLSITLPASYWYLQNFDIVSMEPIVDWFNMMSYDLHGTWDSSDPYIGPYIGAHTNLTEIDQALDLLWRNNIDPAKVTLGLGFYGRSFTLANPSCNTPGCPFTAGGNPGNCTQSAGTLSYSEIEAVISAGATVTLDETAAVKMVTWGTDQWVSYDDQETLKMKYDYANKRCLGGMMVWAVSTDDFLGTAAAALSAATGRTGFTPSLLSVKSEPIGQCVWGECGRDCPPGLSPAQRSDGKNRGNAGIYNGCSNGQTRDYCCPSNDVPTCTWRGTAPFCNGKCHDGEVEVTSDNKATGSSCWTGHKVLCCQQTKSDQAIGACHWEGSAPICAIAPLICPICFYNSASCPSDKPYKLTTGKDGDGGEQSCWYNGGWKSMCCSTPVPFQNCVWGQSSGTWTQWIDANPILNLFGVGKDCKGECPVGKVPVAMDGTGCRTGKSYFCCDDPNPQVTDPPVTNDNLCAVPSSQWPTSGELDSDGDPHHFIEYYPYEDDCWVSGEGADSGDPDDDTNLLRRDSEVIPLFTDDYDSDEDSELTPRYALWVRRDSVYSKLVTRAGGSGRIQKLCANPAGPTRNKRTTTFRSQPYPSVGTLRSAKNFITQAKPLACALAQLTVSKVGSSTVNWVTEHVYELQSVKSYVQSLIDGVLPGGGAVSQGTAPFSIFDASGAFKQTWTSLGVTAPSVGGSTPMESMYSVLGTSSNWNNLQILSSDINGIKALVWAGKQAIGDGNFKTLNPLQKIGKFNMVVKYGTLCS
ncbi:chitinase [Sphaerosporella brunnea]|uniref:chitinase n=1 Tax=Sphaerosporella brunnea TaxID=1250544 RepID=A0A5J5EMB5_9PEZI|nr:chitinase [Sphaerosporella brunnea]